ncbi:MAG: thioredoxin domain-containing protein [Deltaproteobacteria bacterium]|nr:thioredoxin domain-containing protein [Deltaproteobacteria bacterium]
MVENILLIKILIITAVFWATFAFALPGDQHYNDNKKPNHLINEKSPYLLQHAFNPVNWYPWGDEAILIAKQEDKPILLSIGYSTCHWCHVMEKESFTNIKTAEIMNKNFICIKVDREERPDIDKIYITAVSALTGSAGWPLNVFLTPDLKPFFGGSYFPPESKPGMISWIDLLQKIAAAWNDPEQRKKITSSAESLAGTISQYLSSQPAAKEALDSKLSDRAVDAFKSSFDEFSGGFSDAPKFPSPGNQNFLLSYSATHLNSDKNRAKEAKNMALTTLYAIANGGIYDHLGGGFHRYSTDENWHVPHFEKMLYDNAQLIINYLQAYQHNGDSFFKSVARETIEYVLRDMTHPKGGFYSAEDADSFPADFDQAAESKKSREKAEGAFYTWTFKEVRRLLPGTLGEVFAYRYGLSPEGNVKYDPFNEFKGDNILWKAHTLDETAQKFNQPLKEIIQRLKEGEKILFNVRKKRPRPHLDDKVITSWNGLMISAMARGYQILGTESYLLSAKRAAKFIQSHLYDPKKKQLYRSWRDDRTKVLGVASDYAFLIQGLIDLYESDFDLKWLDWAMELADVQLNRFYDARHGGFFMTEANHDKHLIVRVKEEYDNVIPAAGSVSTLNFIRLSGYADRSDLKTAAEKTLKSFVPKMRQNPTAFTQMLVTMNSAQAKPVQIIIAGQANDGDTRDMLKKIRTMSVIGSLPGMTIFLVNNEKDRTRLKKRFSFIESITQKRGKTAAYVCQDFSCSQPVTDANMLQNLLK